MLMPQELLWTHKPTESVAKRGSLTIRVWQRHYNVWILEITKQKGKVSDTLRVTHDPKRVELMTVAEMLVEMLTDPA